MRRTFLKPIPFLALLLLVFAKSASAQFGGIPDKLKIDLREIQCVRND